MELWRAVDAGNRAGVEAQNGAIDGLYCRPVIADSHHFDKEQDPDPDQHFSKKLKAGS
jgi:hypothetical protein